MEPTSFVWRQRTVRRHMRASKCPAWFLCAIITYRVAQNHGKQVVWEQNKKFLFPSRDHISCPTACISYEICTADPPITCQLFRSLSPWMGTTKWNQRWWNFICRILKTCLRWFCAALYIRYCDYFPNSQSQFQYRSLIASWLLVSGFIGYCDYFALVLR